MIFTEIGDSEWCRLFDISLFKFITIFEYLKFKNYSVCIIRELFRSYGKLR